MADTTIHSSLDENDKTNVKFVPSEKWQAPSGNEYDLPAHLFVTIGDIGLSGRADVLVAALDDALTQAQAFMDTEEQDG